jgi:hypothetical protein
MTIKQSVKKKKKKKKRLSKAINKRIIGNTLMPVNKIFCLFYLLLFFIYFYFIYLFYYTINESLYLINEVEISLWARSL